MLNTLKRDLVNARKERNKSKTSVLTALVSEASMIGKNNGDRETTDEETIKVINKFAKGIKDTMSLNITDEKKEELAKELEIYENYLPKLMSEDELTKTIGLFLQTEQNPNIGLVMKFLKENYSGKYDGKMASSVIREILN